MDLVFEMPYFAFFNYFSIKCFYIAYFAQHVIIYSRPMMEKDIHRIMFNNTRWPLVTYNDDPTRSNRSKRTINIGLTRGQIGFALLARLTVGGK